MRSAKVRSAGSQRRCRRATPVHPHDLRHRRVAPTEHARRRPLRPRYLQQTRPLICRTDVNVLCEQTSTREDVERLPPVAIHQLANDQSACDTGAPQKADADRRLRGRCLLGLRCSIGCAAGQTRQTGHTSDSRHLTPGDEWIRPRRLLFSHGKAPCVAVWHSLKARLYSREIHFSGANATLCSDHTRHSTEWNQGDTGRKSAAGPGKMLPPDGEKGSDPSAMKKDCSSARSQGQ